MMKTSINRLCLVLIAAGGLLAQPAARGASSTALSNRTAVDSRDPYPIIELKPELADRSHADGRRIVGFETAQQKVAASAVKYFSLKVPEFGNPGGGWGAKQSGLGCFYGLEIAAALGGSDGAVIQYWVGGTPPTPTNPGAWQGMSFNTILDIELKPGIYYFRVSNIGAPIAREITVAARFQSLRLCTLRGQPLTSLTPAAYPAEPLWLVCHGKNDGEKSLRNMQVELFRAIPGAQVVCVDWSGGAAGSGEEQNSITLNNGRHFLNLAKNLCALLKSKRFSQNQVNLVGHSWGTLVGYETALAFGGVNRFIALDPATQAFGGYIDGRVNFKNVSLASTGVKGGKVKGLFGSEAKATTAHFSMRILSDNPPKLKQAPSFYHSLPRDWFVNAVKNVGSDTYWPYFNNVVLRQEWRPNTPWAVIKPGALAGFDLECLGTTAWDNDAGVAAFKSHKYLLYAKTNRLATYMEAWRDGKYVWSVKKH